MAYLTGLSKETNLRASQLAAAILAKIGELGHQVPAGDTHPESATRTAQDLESIARVLGVLPPLPNNPAVSTVTKSIGTSSRDYSTIAAWEADLDNGAIYSASDDAVGECYNDSVFNEVVNINGGTTVGLSSVTLTAAAGERHDGTAGTGARIVDGTDFVSAVTCGLASRKFSWLEVYKSGGSGSLHVMDLTTLGGMATVSNCLIHGGTITGIGIYLDYAPATILDSIIYGCPGHGIYGRDGVGIYNVTQYGSGAYGLAINDYSGNVVKNTISMDSSTQDFFPSSPASATMDHNLSSDTTSSGTGSLVSKAAADQFVSTTGGSEDLHLKTGADAIDAGTDLVTTPSGVEIDIDGRDRDAEGDTWDIGADEFVSSGVTITVASAIHSHAADSPAITQTHAVAVNDATHSHAADSPAITQTHVIVAANADHAQTADNVTVTVNAVSIVAADSDHAQTSDSPTITQTHIIAASDADHVHTADNTTVMQTHSVIVADATHSHAADNVTATVAGVSIDVDDADHGQTADSPTITQTHVITVSGTIHTHLADNVTVSISEIITGPAGIEFTTTGRPTDFTLDVSLLDYTTIGRPADFTLDSE